MNNLKIFENEEFGKIRTLEINNEPWFVASDICKSLDLINPTMAISRLDEDEKTKLNLGLSGGATNCVNEYGLYNLIIASRKKEAKAFKRWITHDVIPAIRKTGGYVYGEEIMDEDQLILKTMSVLQKKVDKLKIENAQDKQVIASLKPKADYTDLVLKNKALVTITAIAKDYGLSGYSLNQMLHSYGIQYKLGDQWLLYSKYQDKGYVYSETIPITRTDGTSDVKLTTKWTQKGRLFIYNLLKENGLLPTIER